MSEPRDSTVPIPRSKNIGLLGQIIDARKKNRDKFEKFQIIEIIK